MLLHAASVVLILLVWGAIAVFIAFPWIMLIPLAEHSPGARTLFYSVPVVWLATLLGTIYLFW
jgi:hypothetical protein